MVMGLFLGYGLMVFGIFMLFLGVYLVVCFVNDCEYVIVIVFVLILIGFLLGMVSFLEGVMYWVLSGVGVVVIYLGVYIYVWVKCGGE